MHLTAVLVALLLALAAPARAAWRPPVDCPVTRGFDVGANPFEGGRHRGVDLSAPPGATVRAPCGGEVVVAGRVGTSGRVVTLLCGHWRVTQMPLLTIAVRRGATVRVGTRLGTLAPSRDHGGLHFGVRRDGTRFGYVDPLRFLAPDRPRPPVAIGRRGPRGPTPRPFPATPRPLPATPRPLPATPRQVGAPAVRVGGRAGSRSPAGLAPWPAWAGLALVLGGMGVGWRARVRVRIRGPVRGRQLPTG